MLTNGLGSAYPNKPQGYLWRAEAVVLQHREVLLQPHLIRLLDYTDGKDTRDFHKTSCWQGNGLHQIQEPSIIQESWMLRREYSPQYTNHQQIRQSSLQENLRPINI